MKAINHLVKKDAFREAFQEALRQALFFSSHHYDLPVVEPLNDSRTGEL